LQLDQATAQLGAIVARAAQILTGPLTGLLQFVHTLAQFENGPASLAILKQDCMCRRQKSAGQRQRAQRTHKPWVHGGAAHQR
jgi:hypothetical protein